MLTVLSVATALSMGGDTPYDEMVRVRRHIHANPELSNREIDTQRFLEEQFERAAFHHVEKMAGTGLRVIHDTRKPGPTIAFRAELDALPIHEETGLAFSSKRDGVAHACGHDLHTAILFGTALAIRADPNLTGKYVFLFQPAEEGPPEGEIGGAGLMMVEGALRDPVPDVIFALHVMDFLDVGEVGCAEGQVMAAAKRFRLSLQGSGGHPSGEGSGTNPLLALAELVEAIREINKEFAIQEDRAIVSLGAANAGNRFNIVPSEAVLRGSVRSLKDHALDAISEKFEARVRRISSQHGLDHELVFDLNYPSLHNDEVWAARAKDVIKDEDLDLVDVEPILAADDFAIFAGQVPAVYFFLGANDPDQPSGPLHTSGFNPSERAMETGFRLFYALARAFGAP